MAMDSNKLIMSCKYSVCLGVLMVCNCIFAIDEQNTIIAQTTTLKSDHDNRRENEPRTYQSSLQEAYQNVYPMLDMPMFRPVWSSIEKGARDVFYYKLNISYLSQWPAFNLEFYAETSDPVNTSRIDRFNDSLVVTAHWQRNVKTWNIPIVNVDANDAKGHVNRYTDNAISKTVWYQQPKYSQNQANLTIEVSSYSDILVYFKIRISSQKNFNVMPEKSYSALATHTSPAFFKFEIPDSWDYIFIHAVSQSDVCTHLTVERYKGPFLNMDEKLQKFQLSLSFTEKAGMTIKRENFSKGFLLSFTPFSGNEDCNIGATRSVWTGNDQRKKFITFQVRKAMSPRSYLRPMAVPVIAFALLTTIVITLTMVFNALRKSAVKSANAVIIKRCLYQFNSNITISDLIVTEPSRVVDQSRRYCAAGFVTSAFYSVPVFQLIFSFSRRLNETGNFDLCYFNHLCSHMLGNFYDFNHMYSNIWYILFGLLYMFMVYIRQRTVTPDKDKGKNAFQFFRRTAQRLDRGVMTHFGLLYYLGFSFIMTGVMSAAYHICPNQNNFQFDTVFMYSISAITIVTLYQARHPTYLSANFTFTTLAFVTVITVMGLLWEVFYIRVLFSATHLSFLLITVPKICYSGYIRKNGELVVHWFEVMEILLSKLKDDWKNRRAFQFQREEWRDPKDGNIVVIAGPGRVVLPTFLLIINGCAIAAMWTILLDQNFATQVLFICVTNGALYTVFYTVLKIFHGECRRILWMQPLIYIILSFALWGFSLSYFLDESSSWEASPAESRLKNRDCTTLSFYDYHDMWHFLSSAALFFSAMVMLTVDDDLVDQPKSTIPVF